MLSVVTAGLSGVDTSILYLSCRGKDSQKIFGRYNSLQTAGLLVAAAVFSLFIRDNYPLSGLLTAVSYGGAALVLNLLVYVGMSGILSLLQVPKSLLLMMEEYVSVIFFGIFFVFLYNYTPFLSLLPRTMELPAEIG